MNWDDLRIVAAVRDTGTYAGAGAKLRIDETTVGRRLVRIERTLGIRLFEAIDGARKPTRQCEVVLGHVQEPWSASRWQFPTEGAFRKDGCCWTVVGRLHQYAGGLVSCRSPSIMILQLGRRHHRRQSGRTWRTPVWRDHGLYRHRCCG